MDQTDPAARLRDLQSLDHRAERREKILAGDSFPDTAELLTGLPFFKGDLLQDLRTHLKCQLLEPSYNDDERAALQLALDNPSRSTLSAASLEIAYESDLVWRLDLYGAWLGDQGCADRTIRRCVYSMHVSDAIDYAHRLGLGLGMAARRLPSRTAFTVERFEATIINGMEMLGRSRRLAERLEVALALAADDDEAALQAVFNAGDEIDDSIPYEYPPEPEPPGAIVVPVLDITKGTQHQRDIKKSWSGIAGERLPLVQVDDIAASAARLVARWPWAEDIIHTMLTDLAQGGDVVFRNTVLVGDPGTGKSALLRAIAEEVGLPVQRVDLAGSADSSMMGTSSRYSTAEESAVLRQIRLTKHASICMIWDELEKAKDSDQNGYILEALLPFLERDQARTLRDPCLGVDVDLSFVSHFATANSLKGVPDPLRDRMRVLRMGSPGWQHLGQLTENVLDKIAKRLGRDRRWYPPLAEDELDIIRDQWSGGSLRRVERYVELIVAGRDKHHIFGRA